MKLRRLYAPLARLTQQERFFFGGVVVSFGGLWLPTIVGVPWGTPFLELVFAVVCLLGLRRGTRPEQLTFSIIILGYVFLSAVYAVLARGANLLDFFVIYKAFWYLLLLCFVAGKKILTAADIANLSRLLLWIFLVVYSFKRVVLHDDRPIVLIENNFELVFLVLVFYACYCVTSKLDSLAAGQLLAIVVLSGSRSAAVVAAVTLACTVQVRKIRRQDLLLILVMPLVAILTLFVFKARSQGGLETIDRYRFFLEFLEATKGWGVSRYLFGAARITPLPVDVCSSLSYYRTLFSFSGNGTCYSEIFHAFDLRAIYDHGLAVLVAMLFLLWRLMRAQPKKVRMCVIAVLLLTGLSVSSLNNVYVALGLIFFVTKRREAVRARQSVEPCAT